MSTPTARRRKIGVVIAFMALAALPIFAFTGVPLVTGSSAYFVETGTVTHSVHLHWPLAPIAVLLIVGLLLIALPPQKAASHDKRT